MMPRKYHPGTIDNEQVLADINRRTHRRIKESLISEGTRPFQSVEKIMQQQADLQELVNAALNVQAASDDSSGFGLTSAGVWVRVCAVSIRVPQGRGMCSLQATGSCMLQAAGMTVGDGYGVRLLADGRRIAEATATRQSTESDLWEALCSGVLNLSGLQADAVIPVVLQAYTADAVDWPAVASNQALLNVQAAFPAPAAQTMGHPTVALSAMKEADDHAGDR